MGPLKDSANLLVLTDRSFEHDYAASQTRELLAIRKREERMRFSDYQHGNPSFDDVRQVFESEGNVNVVGRLMILARSLI